MQLTQHFLTLALLIGLLSLLACPFPAALRLHAAIRNSELHRYANKGHVLRIEDAPRFFDEVRRFIAT